MRVVPADLQTRLSQRSGTLAHAMIITRRDGNVIRITDAQDDFYYDGSTYSAYPGFVFESLSFGESGEFASVDMTIGTIDTGSPSNPIVASDVINGYFDGAIAEVFVIDFEDPDAGVVQLGARFTLGDIEYDNNQMTAKIGLRSEAASAIEYSLRLIMPPCAWTLGDERCGVPVRPDDVQRNTAYAVGDYVRVSNGGDYRNRMFRCTTAGTTASSPPAYDYTAGQTTTDGTAQFQAEEAWIRSGTISAVLSRRSFSASITEPRGVDGWWRYGAVRFTSGANINISRDIRRSVGSNIELWIGFPGAIQVGDEFEIFPGCDLSTGSGGCGKFDNILRFGGFPFVTEKGFDVAQQEITIRK